MINGLKLRSPIIKMNGYFAWDCRSKPQQKLLFGNNDLNNFKQNRQVINKVFTKQMINYFDCMT